MRPKPLIGVTLDHEPAGGWASLPWYALRQNYADAIAAVGGVPLALPHHADLAEDFLAALDGLVITGGAFDVDPALYGGGEMHATVTLKQDRTASELALTRGALARNLPILGICGGEQLLAVVLGGTLIQHIPDDIADALAHEQPNPRDEPGHKITVTETTLLHKIIGSTTMNINSSHHQAVKTVGRGRINAVAPDGVIEGIECGEYKFCLGVQWHPEYFIDQGDRKIFAALIEAARQ
jgi:putative glutamine amidotransferase